MATISPLITTRLGKIIGKVARDYLGGKYYSFQGIPYAKPPVGNFRFKAPQPVEPWTDVLNAKKEGPECPSRHMIFQYFIGQEDNCLNLSVYIKEMPKPDAPLKPVMVWIHGGGFIQGSNRTDLYGPEYLMTEDVIQVMINYRVGLLGFLSLEDSSLGVHGNAGLKDQTMALKWIKNNIDSFGGDPENITIYGESAGSASVHYLMLSPTTKGLFNKVIMQSGCALNEWGRTARGVSALKNHLNNKVTDEKELLEYLQTLSPRELLSTQEKLREVFAAGEPRPYGPVIEKPSEEAFLTEDPVNILKSGNYNKVPVMIGITTNEGLLFELLRKVCDMPWPVDFKSEIPKEFSHKLDTNTTTALAEEIKKFYKFRDTSSEEELISTTCLLKSDNFFVHGIHRTVNYLLQNNGHPLYYYVFSFEGECNYFKKLATSKAATYYGACLYVKSCFESKTMKNMLDKMGEVAGFKQIGGTCHADDLMYLFKPKFSKEVDQNSPEGKTTRRLVKLWTNFAKYGNPTPQDVESGVDVLWKPAEKGKLFYLGIGDDLKMGENPYAERNNFWDKIYDAHSQ